MAEREGESEHLSELRRRWEEEPSSRLFLQLAEEYRRVGRTEEALEVLEQGLGHNPRHVSAQVAKGRCLLDLGRAEAAAVALRQVLANDATHLVASKLLVEAYILQGDALQARRQLEHYGTLSNADPEVETLRERIQDLVLSDAEPPAEPAAAAPPAAAEEPAAPAAPGPPAAPADLVRSLSPLPAEDPFPDLHAPGDRERSLGRFAADGVFEPFAAPAAETEEAAEVEEPAAAVEVVAAGEAPEREEVPAWEEEAAGVEPAGAEPEAAARAEEDDTVPLGPWGSRRGAAAAAEPGPGEEPFPGLAAEPRPAFAFEPDLEAPSAVAPSEPAPTSPEGEEAVDAGLPALAVPPPAAAPRAAPAAAEGGEEEPATATLGQLYLRQGHHAEAERIFRRVLEREPDNRAAREGLASLPGEVPAAMTASGDGPTDTDAVAGELVARKAQLLRRYLSILRRGAERDVS
jgi:tetratricopeptide (TPR) repeat protein